VEKIDAMQIMSALSQTTRLDVLRLLIAAEDGMASGELATATGSPPNTMSAHLAILLRAGLVTSRRSGRSAIYHAVPSQIRGVADFLSELCKAKR
jgi:DNA-binding transcriptional ArsR family regulator